MHDISHYLRPAHLAQLRRIIDDPEASGNDRFVALDLLKNVNISAGGVLPMCQDTGTAIVMGKKSEGVLTGADDGEAISPGVYDAYTKLNLRYSQLAPLTTCEEKNTGTNLPAQIELYSTPQTSGRPEYKFLFMAKGGGSANKSFLFQETKAVLNPKRMLEFLDEKIRSLGTAACPPYHLAVVIGGTSAEFALKTAKYASAHYLDNLPTEGSMSAHGFRDTRAGGGGLQAHPVVRHRRPVRRQVLLPRRPRRPAAAARRLAARSRSRSPARPTARRWARSPPRASSSSSSRPTRRSTCPTPGWHHDIAGGDVVQIDLNQPMAEILAELSKHPVKTRLSLTGPLVVARDIAHAKIKERLDAGEEMPAYLKDHPVYYAGPAKTPEGMASGSFGPTTAGRMDSYVEQFQAAGGSMVMLAKGNRSKQVTEACDAHGGFYLGSIGGPAARLAQDCIKAVVGAGVRGARHGGGLEDRGRGLPRLHRGRRQGQRLLHRPLRRRHRAADRDPGPLGGVAAESRVRPWRAGVGHPARCRGDLVTQPDRVPIDPVLVAAAQHDRQVRIGRRDGLHDLAGGGDVLQRGHRHHDRGGPPGDHRREPGLRRDVAAQVDHVHAGAAQGDGEGQHPELVAGAAGQPDQDPGTARLTGGGLEERAEMPLHAGADEVLLRDADATLAPRCAQARQGRHQPPVDDVLERAEGEAGLDRVVQAGDVEMGRDPGQRLGRPSSPHAAWAHRPPSRRGADPHGRLAGARTRSRPCRPWRSTGAAPRRRRVAPVPTWFLHHDAPPAEPRS